MSVQDAHRWVAQISRDGQPALTTPALDIDWTPAAECLHFQQVRRGAADLESAPPPVRVRPQWDARTGPPYVAAIEVLAEGAARSGGEPIGLKYLTDPVRRAVSAMVEAGRIAEGAAYTWRICAYEHGGAPRAEPAHDACTVHAAPPEPQRLPTRRTDELRRRAVREGPPADAAAADDFPVFMPRSVLSQAEDTATAAGELEAGGILLGRVSRCAERGDLIAEVTAQVPASEAVADDASLRFTPQTWAAVRAAIGLRRAGERIVGWWHSHPRSVWPCRDCPPERRARCPSNHAFFSAQDAAFHRTAFQGPVNVALLLTFHDAPSPRHDLFGWRQGRVAARELYLMEEPA